LALLLLVLISGCGPQASKTPARTSPSASPAATATPTETATAAGTSAPQGFTCRLPVVTNNDAGWLTFPSATFQSDPKANVHLPVAPSGPVSKSYDKAFERWLPVARDSISPDGKHYVYADPPYPGMYAQGSVPPSRIRVVDTASGADHSFNPGNVGADSSWWVLDYENEGVYLAVLGYGPSAPLGLWLLDPSSGTVRQIDSTRIWQSISGGAAWGTDDALTGHGPGPGSRLMRMDLKTGAIVSWYKRTDVEFIVAGADAAGHPVLQVTTLGAPAIILVTAQNTAAPLSIAAGSSAPVIGIYIHPVSDSHGMWLGDTSGSISLYTAATGIKKMAQVGSAEVTAGGGCH
jgi:hypothetical protein